MNPTSYAGSRGVSSVASLKVQDRERFRGAGLQYQNDRLTLDFKCRSRMAYNHGGHGVYPGRAGALGK